jgi:hypothetical protein
MALFHLAFPSKALMEQGFKKVGLLSPPAFPLHKWLKRLIKMQIPPFFPDF